MRPLAQQQLEKFSRTTHICNAGACLRHNSLPESQDFTMEEREVTDSQGITWSCVQAYSGLSDDAAHVKGDENKYWVVCTPSGGAQSVRIQLENDWQHDCSDETLLNQIAAAQKD